MTNSLNALSTTHISMNIFMLMYTYLHVMHINERVNRMHNERETQIKTTPHPYIHTYIHVCKCIMTMMPMRMCKDDKTLAWPTSFLAEFNKEGVYIHTSTYEKITK